MNTCNKCDRRLLLSGDHLCGECSKATGRPTTAPYWGNFVERRQ